MSDQFTRDIQAWLNDHGASPRLREDGIGGAKTRTELAKYLKDFATLQNAGAPFPPLPQNLDARTKANILSLHPSIQSKAAAFMERIRTELGDFRITSGYRSYEEQNALYAQGRTKPGKIVTGARGGFSNHNFGLAFDITLFVDGQPKWEDPLYLRAGKIGEEMGWDWAGGGTGEDFNDIPHFELPGATDNVAKYRERKALGLDVLG